MPWGELVSIKREAMEEARAERMQKPQACPNDGEPLRPGPDGRLYCPWGDWQEN